MNSIINEFRAKAFSEYYTGTDHNRHQIRIKGNNADFRDICKRYGLTVEQSTNNGYIIGEYAKGNGYRVINYFALCGDIVLSIAL